MAALKKQASVLKELQEQVGALKRREKATQKKLRLALAKVKKIAMSYEKKLVRKAKDTHVKVAAAEAAVYTKLAKSIKRHVDDSKKGTGKKVQVKK
jgi:hypothetical protein